MKTNKNYARNDLVFGVLDFSVLSNLMHAVCNFCTMLPLNGYVVFFNM